MSEEQMLDVEESLHWLRKYEPTVAYVGQEWEVVIQTPDKRVATGDDLRFVLDQLIRKLVRERNRGKNESAN